MNDLGAYQNFIAFGELLLRLSSPRGQLLSTTRHLDVDVGGSEANVAAALGALGRGCRLISAVPDNGLGDAAIAAVRSQGVDCRAVLRAWPHGTVLAGKRRRQPTRRRDL